MAIHQEKCPKCDVINCYDNGDESDLTKLDVESVQCWRCGLWWLLPGAEEWTNLLAAHRACGHKEIK